ncbi:right-handed parallel beta-helix repeat-containing protein, partial [Candidatus Desantisbacteria bacterium]|nr:right-handed parallel beta-helix repeat-containing protein [Candidatus Desantisbacteria bacterium]
PDEKKAGLNKNEDGTSQTSFLRINNQRNSDLCTNCHKNQGFVLKTPHDMVELAFNEKNILGKTAGANGTCSACHLTHRSKDKKLFAREFGPGDDIITKKCNSCHNKEKVAEKKLLAGNSHTINSPLFSKKMATNLPLFDKEGNKNPKGTIKCLTCHDAHQWTQDKSKLGQEVKNENITITQEIIEKGIIGKIVFIKGTNVYIDILDNIKAEIKKDQILSIFKNNTILCRLKVLNVNPFAKQSEIYAVVITEGAAGKISIDDIVFDPTKLDVTLGGGVNGDGNNSFLNIQNSKSELCIDCHKNKKQIFGTKHDISIVAPNFANSIGQTVSTSGTCSACHIIHNTDGAYLIDQNKKDPEKIDVLSKTCRICHTGTGIASNKIPQNHHLIRMFPEDRIDISPPPPFMPLYDIDGKIGFWDFVSCATCHNVHQWDPRNPDKHELNEGDSTNNFLRMNSSDNQLCDACHVSRYNMKMTNDPDETKTQPVQQNKNYGISEPGQDKKEIIISEGGPKISIVSPKNNSILTSKEQIISGNISDSSIPKAMIILNGNPQIIPVSLGIFEEKLIFKEGKNFFKILATNLDGKSGASEEINVLIDTNKSGIIGFDYPKPVTLMDNFQMKIIFNQSMDSKITPIIYLLTSDSKTIILETQVSAKAVFIGHFEPLTPLDPQIYSEIKQGDMILNAKEYYGFEQKPLVIIKDLLKNKNPGPGNDEVQIIAASPTEPNGETFAIKEHPVYEGIFSGDFEFGRWEEYGDNLLGIEDKNSFTVTYNLGEWTSTNKTNDTFTSTPIKITRNMKGEVNIVVENAKSINGNVIERDNSESFVVYPDLFNMKNKKPVSILEGIDIRTTDIHLIFSAEEATQMFISEKFDLSSGKWEPYAKEKKYFLLNHQTGNRKIYFKFKNKFDAESPVFMVDFKYSPVEYNMILDKDITKDTIFEADMGPFMIRKSIKIDEGVTVKIKEGCVFWFDASSKEKIKISVPGKLEAEGSNEKRIVFSSNALNPKKSEWEGIEFINSKQNILKFIDVLYSDKGVVLINSQAIIENCKFEFNNLSGLTCNKTSDTIISFNKFINNDIGILISNNSNPKIMNNYITNNNTGILCEIISTPRIINNSITKNMSTGIKCIEMSSPAISDNEISNNTEYGIYIKKASPMIYHNNIVENMIGILCEEYHNPFLIKNNNILNNKDYAIKLSNFDQNLDAAKNWWGTKNPEIIKKYLYDYWKDNSSGKVLFLPYMEASAIFTNINIVIDQNKPVILTCDYQKMANLTSHFQISFVFNESLNPFVIPEISLVHKKTGEKIISKTGRFSYITFENDTFIASDITLFESMAGDIDIYIENVQDVTGNIIDKTLAGTFTLDPTVKNTEGDYLSSSLLTLNISAPDAISIMISEDPKFTGKEWEDFTPLKKINISEEEGEKIIYIRTRDKTGASSPVSQYMVHLDKTPPLILNPVYNVPKVKELFNLKLYFSERLAPGCKPKVILKSLNNNTFTLPDGKITSATFIDDTYTVPPVTLPENIEGYITILVENVGRKIERTLK